MSQCQANSRSRLHFLAITWLNLMLFHYAESYECYREMQHLFKRISINKAKYNQVFCIKPEVRQQSVCILLWDTSLYFLNYFQSYGPNLSVTQISPFFSTAHTSGLLRITAVWPSVLQGFISLLLQFDGLNVLTISISSISHIKPRPCVQTVMATHQVWPLSSPSLHGWQSIKSARLGEVPNNLCCAHWASPHPEDDPEI